MDRDSRTRESHSTSSGRENLTVAGLKNVADRRTK